MSQLANAPYRVSSLRCPRCPSRPLGDGPLHHCTQCVGTWVDEESLSERVATMRVAITRPLVWSVDGTRAQLPCAACGEAMQALSLFSVPVDRCRAHGVWFDAGELALVLERSWCEPNAAIVVPVAAIATAAVVAQSAQPPLIDGPIDVLNAVDVAVNATYVVAEVASSGIFEVVLEGTLEILGAIFSAIVS